MWESWGAGSAYRRQDQIRPTRTPTGLRSREPRSRLKMGSATEVTGLVGFGGLSPRPQGTPPAQCEPTRRGESV